MKCLFLIVVLLAAEAVVCGSVVVAADTGASGTATANLVDAAESQDWKAVKRLVASGENLDLQQPDGMTALHWASFHGRVDVVASLLAAKVSATEKNRYSQTPLGLACASGRQGAAEIVQLLLAAGADPNQKLPGAVTPIMLAARAGHAGVIRELFKQDAKLDLKERRGQTALMWAAAEGNEEAVDALLDAGADYEHYVKSGFDAMMFAARQGHTKVVASLLRQGVDVNAVMKSSKSGARAPRKGTSALTLAVESGHFELALFLVQNGADPNDQRSGFAPLHSLSWVRKPKRGEEPDGDPPPRGSGQLTSLEFAKAIIQLGADPNLQLTKGRSGKAVLGHKGATPILLAGKTADLPYLVLLHEMGGDLATPNDEGATALMAAAGVGVQAVGEEPGSVAEIKETLDFLIACGLDVNEVDSNKETAMHGAAYRNFPEIVEHLTACGASPAIWNNKNSSGWTPVMIAQGKRPGSFKPSPKTEAALQVVLNAAE